MSKPRYWWYGNVCRTIGEYPKLSRQVRDMSRQKITPGYSSQPGGQSSGRAVEDIAVRVLSSREYEDYTALANYLHGHWRKEFGGHRYKASRSCVRPEPEPATEAVRDYSLTRPPVAPRGYILVESRATQYGFLYFKYVWDPKNETHKRTGSRLL